MAFFYEADKFWVDQSTWPVDVSTATPTFGKLIPVSFFSSAEKENLADSFSDPFGYLRTSKTHLQRIQKHSNLEIEGENQEKKESLQLSPNFYTFLQIAAWFHSSTFFLVSFCLFMMYSLINMLG